MVRKLIIPVFLFALVLCLAGYRIYSGFPGDYVNVCDFGATGDGVTDDTAAIQAALDSLASGDTLLFPEGIYLVSDQLDFDGNGIGLNGVTLKGAGGVRGTYIQWNASADDTKAIMRMSWISWSKIENIYFYGGATNKPGFAFWVTSQGGSAPNTTSNNIFEHCAFQSGTKAGLRFGSETGIDVTLDMNVVRSCSALFNGVGIIIGNNNCNSTRIESCAISDNDIAGIEACRGTRDVSLQNNQYAGNGSQDILIELCLNMSIYDSVVELQNDYPFIVAEAASQRECNLMINNLFVTNSNSPGVKIIDYEQNGIVTMMNCHIAGTADPIVEGQTGQLYFAGNGSAQNGGRMLITSGVHLHTGAHITCVSGAATASDFRWIDLGTTYAASAIAPAGAPKINLPSFSVERGETSAGYIDFVEDSDHGASHVRVQGPSSVTGDVTITLPDAGGTAVVSTSASHDYQAGSTAWTMTTAEAAATLFTVTNAGGAADAVFPAAVAGKQFTVYNDSGANITFKVSGQTGSAVADGKYAIFTMNSSDCIEIYEQP